MTVADILSARHRGLGLPVLLPDANEFNHDVVNPMFPSLGSLTRIRFRSKWIRRPPAQPSRPHHAPGCAWRTSDPATRPRARSGRGPSRPANRRTSCRSRPAGDMPHARTRYRRSRAGTSVTNPDAAPRVSNQFDGRREAAHTRSARGTGTQTSTQLPDTGDSRACPRRTHWEGWEKTRTSAVNATHEGGQGSEGPPGGVWAPVVTPSENGSRSR